MEVTIESRIVRKEWDVFCRNLRAYAEKVFSGALFEDVPADDPYRLRYLDQCFRLIFEPQDGGAPQCKNGGLLPESDTILLSRISRAALVLETFLRTHDGLAVPASLPRQKALYDFFRDLIHPPILS